MLVIINSTVYVAYSALAGKVVVSERGCSAFQALKPGFEYILGVTREIQLVVQNKQS